MNVIYLLLLVPTIPQTDLGSCCLTLTNNINNVNVKYSSFLLLPLVYKTLFPNTNTKPLQYLMLNNLFTSISAHLLEVSNKL